jgi:uncharacterized protein (DUF697 family)
MSLKTAAFLALIGMILVTILRLSELIFAIINVMGGLVPAVVLLSNLIYAFGSVALTIFFARFYKQS